MFGPLVACVLAFVPSPAPDHFTEAHAAVYAVVQEAAIAEAVHQRFHCLEALNAGPYTPPPIETPPKPQNTKPATGTPGNVEQWRGIVSGYGWNVDSALRVMACESRGDPGAISPTDDWGLMQINRPTWETTYGPAESWLDPATNVAVAYEIWKQGGWAWWSCGWAA